MGWGNLDTPYVENPFAGRIVNVHWRHKKPGVGTPRTVFGMLATGAAAYGTWSISEAVPGSGGESGSVVLQWGGGGIGNIYTNTMSLISHSGTNIYNSVPVKFVSVAPGAEWEMSLTATVDPAQFGEEGSADIKIVTVNLDESPGSTVLSVSVPINIIPFPGGTDSQSTGGLAPS